MTYRRKWDFILDAVISGYLEHGMPFRIFGNDKAKEELIRLLGGTA